MYKSQSRINNKTIVLRITITCVHLSWNLRICTIKQPGKGTSIDFIHVSEITILYTVSLEAQFTAITLHEQFKSNVRVMIQANQPASYDNSTAYNPIKETHVTNLLDISSQSHFICSYPSPIHYDGQQKPSQVNHPSPNARK